MSPSIKRIGSLFIVLALVTGCAGRAARPIAINQHEDSSRSCETIASEIKFIDLEIGRLTLEREKHGLNVALWVVGFITIVPWFFMDMKQAEKQEIEALQKRFNQLIILGDKKNCDLGRSQIEEISKETTQTNLDLK